jgi:radical SAM-linked protein
MAKFIDAPRILGAKLLTIEKPVRYVGGEYGILSKKDAGFQTVIAFPDLYEVGMSNKALRILYNRLNNIDGISCERVFALPPEAETLFRENNIPLYGLDNGLVVQSADLLMFTFGYELGITSVLSILEMSGIPLRNEERGEDDPLVIAGGPCVSNPLPYSSFIDAFWIGEAEAGFFPLAEKLRDAKKAGKGRAALLSLITSHPNVWTKGKTKATRAIDTGFSDRTQDACVFPVPSLKAVQHHGYVEIMRGCPNGCRFCHAGIWYRPMRQKRASLILEDTEAFIEEGGYNEISLSSLSSGDYDHIDSLVDTLNDRYEKKRISFQLPSLHVSTLSLPLLEKIAKVRKSGLTFAVETPVDYWQISINKQVTLDMCADILRTAKQNGWKSAKFYFMIGLPVRHNSENGSQVCAGEKGEQPEEETAIVSFIRELQARCRMTFNINVGVFVPKPHTPYQWEPQLDPAAALKKFFSIKDSLRPGGHKVSFQDPLVSMIEGVLSRGDERVGEVIEDAYRHGARLDAWSDYFKKDVWEAALQRNDVSYSYNVSVPLPWDVIDSKTSPRYLKREKNASEKREFTLQCNIKCIWLCGVCNTHRIPTARNAELCSKRREFALLCNINHTQLFESCELRTTKDAGVSPNQEEYALLCEKKHTESCKICDSDRIAVVKNTETLYSARKEPETHALSVKKADPDVVRILFLFEKKGKTVFLSHLNLVNVFQMAFRRAGIPVLYSAGFNPTPLLDFASPLPLAIAGMNEAATIDLDTDAAAFDDGVFAANLTAALPEGLAVREALCVTVRTGVKKYSPAALYYGGIYEHNGEEFTVPSSEEKAFKEKIIAEHGSLLGLERIRPLAFNPKTRTGGHAYWSVYHTLYFQ